MTPSPANSVRPILRVFMVLGATSSLLFLGCGPSEQTPSASRTRSVAKPVQTGSGANPNQPKPGKPVAEPASATVPNGSAEYIPEPTPAARQVEEVLNRRFSLELLDVPLSELGTRLTKQLDIPVSLAEKELENEGIDLSTPITIRIKNQPLVTGLQSALKRFRLEIFASKGKLIITTPVAAEEFLITRTYPVNDLCRMPGAQNALIDAIYSQIPSATWMSVDGTGGTIVADQKSQSLTITQTWSIHCKILQLIRKRRKETARDEG